MMVRLIAMLVMVGAGLGLLSAGPAMASVGCTTKEHSWKAQAAGATAYTFTMSVHYCWKGVPFSPNLTKVDKIYGGAWTSANWTFQTQNAIGPANSGKAPIPSSTKYALGKTVYGFFQHRACATGPLGLACTGWEWTKVKATLYDNGKIVWG